MPPTNDPAPELGLPYDEEPPYDPWDEPPFDPYDDQDAAWLAVAVMRAGRLRTPDLDVYRCRCGLWHITSRREH